MVWDKAQEDRDGERRENRASRCPLPPFPGSRLIVSKDLGDEVRLWRESFEVPGCTDSKLRWSSVSTF